ncbi:hypothetical protein AURDEDRAFT_166247 [Auricularia subglabra TFB-10046 SS5]|nr:hypothetical protein AURDEDRAFT_166247 [Auricularia subglabra TFB-10046 SS5]
MASTTADQESALRASVLDLLKNTTRGMERYLRLWTAIEDADILFVALTRSSDVNGAIAGALAVFSSAVAHFAGEFNRARPPSVWDKLPEELKLEVVRRLPLAHCAKMLRVSRVTRALLLSDPSLWTKISIPPLSIDARVEILRTMAVRSGSCPLDLTWIDPWDSGSFLPNPPRDVILQSLPRVRTLSLHMSYFLPGPERFWAFSASLLEQLSMVHEMHLCYIISPDLCSGTTVPSLRELNIGIFAIQGPPHAPFASVVSFEGNIARATTGLEWLWDWFPRLQTLVLYVCGNDFPSVPPPPRRLQHVILHATLYCTNPVRALHEWDGRSVRLLEVYGAEDGLQSAVDFLGRDESWSASFTPACRPGEHWRNTTVVGAGDVTIAFWETSPYNQRLQIHTPGLMTRLEALTLGAGVLVSAFWEDVAFPALRSLTVFGSDDVGAILYDRTQTMRAPVLEELVVDLASDERAQEIFDRLPELARRMRHSQPLRAILIRLANDFDRHSPSIADVSMKLAPMARDVRIEYHPDAQCRLVPCVC